MKHCTDDMVLLSLKKNCAGVSPAAFLLGLEWRGPGLIYASLIA
jgi:hypothetical protein